MDIRNFRVGFPAAAPQHSQAGHNLVVTAGEKMEHTAGIFRTFGLAQNLAVANHNGIRRDDDIIAPPRHRLRFPAADQRHLLGGRTGRDGCGGATSSSKSHNLHSLETCGAEVQKGKAPEVFAVPKLGSDRSGTGDVFSSVIVGDLVRGRAFADAVRHAATFVSKAVARTIDMGLPATDGLAIEEVLSELVTG